MDKQQAIHNIEMYVRTNAAEYVRIDDVDEQALGDDVLWIFDHAFDTAGFSEAEVRDAVQRTLSEMEAEAADRRLCREM